MFEYLCTEADIDLIVIDASRRQPFAFRKSWISAALKRNIQFEISYGTALSGTLMLLCITLILLINQFCRYIQSSIFHLKSHFSRKSNERTQYNSLQWSFACDFPPIALRSNEFSDCSGVESLESNGYDVFESKTIDRTNW